MVSDCKICYNLVDKHTLCEICNNNYCSMCINKYITIQIGDNKSDIKCICFIKLTDKQIYLLLSKTIIDKQLKQLLYTQHLNNVGTKNNIIFIKCVHCKFIINEKDIKLNEKYHICIHCNYKFCIKCLKDKHEWFNFCNIKKYKIKLYNIEHRVNERIVEEKKTKQYLDILIKTKTYRNCPHCGILTHRISGCNSMRCTKCYKYYDWSTI
jgi:hypothetical protein